MEHSRDPVGGLVPEPISRELWQKSCGASPTPTFGEQQLREDCSLLSGTRRELALSVGGGKAADQRIQVCALRVV